MHLKLKSYSVAAVLLPAAVDTFCINKFFVNFPPAMF